MQDSMQIPIPGSGHFPSGSAVNRHHNSIVIYLRNIAVLYVVRH